MIDSTALKAHFTEVFGGGGKIHVIRAPGRVNLIGEHTDYNDGFVCPMAIEPEVLFVCRAREDQSIRLASTVFPGQLVEFSIARKIEPGDPAWANYSRGVVAGMLAAGVPLIGMDALIENTLPVGGGLSSSAAIEVGTAHCLLALTGQTMDPMRLALLCQKAEHEFAGVPVGIMDQMIVATAQAGHATLFDCREFLRQYVSMDPRELRVVIVNSMVKHELTGGEYAQRRRQCQDGVKFFQQENPQVRALRDVSLKQLEGAKGKLDDLTWRRCRHVITENARAVEAANLLEQHKYEQAGELMVRSHNSLRDDYQVSVEELDFLSAEAMQVKGVYGARMTGGGFGGCIVALTQPRAVEPLTAHLIKTYEQRFQKSPAIYVTTATAGASVLE